MTSNNISQLELDWYAHDLDFDLAEYARTNLKNPHPTSASLVAVAFQKAFAAAAKEPRYPEPEPAVHPLLVDWVMV